MTEHDDMQSWIDDCDKSGREDLVQKYHYLCRRGALKYARRAEDRADFEQTAAIGLIKAVDRYRKDIGTPFEAYAWIIIQGELSHYVRDAERMLRAPRRLRTLERRWRDARELLRGGLNREPTDGEVAEHLVLDVDTIRDLYEYRDRARVESLDALPSASASGAVYTIEEHDDRLMIEAALRALTPLERDVFVETVWRDRSLAELSNRLGYSQRHLSRVRREAIRKLGPLCVIAGTRAGY
jgi:RNA polymerase sigma-B factor